MHRAKVQLRDCLDRKWFGAWRVKR
jgi:hypothetical protein